jgi:hypothetical protein
VARHCCTWRPTVSDKMLPHNTPSTQERTGPMIPSRSSSIARAREPKTQKSQKGSSNHRTFKDDVTQSSFSDDYSVPSEPTVHRSRSTDRAQPPLGSEMRSNSRSRQSQSFSQSVQVQRWAGLTRSVCNWDGLRRVSQCW